VGSRGRYWSREGGPASKMDKVIQSGYHKHKYAGIPNTTFRPPTLSGARALSSLLNENKQRGKIGAVEGSPPVAVKEMSQYYDQQ
jgi:hypothetical protein